MPLCYLVFSSPGLKQMEQLPSNPITRESAVTIHLSIGVEWVRGRQSSFKLCRHRCLMLSAAPYLEHALYSPVCVYSVFALSVIFSWLARIERFDSLCENSGSFPRPLKSAQTEKTARKFFLNFKHERHLRWQPLLLNVYTTLAVKGHLVMFLRGSSHSMSIPEVRSNTFGFLCLSESLVVDTRNRLQQVEWQQLNRLKILAL